MKSGYIKEAKIIPIIKIRTLIGDGTEENPIREGFEYWDMNGNFLFIGEI